MAAVSYKSFPLLMRKSTRQIKVAAAKTLTTIAFDARVEVIDQAEKDLEFRVNARRALGITVKKARPNATTIEAAVFTTRGWFWWHINEGRRRARSGWKFNGKDYLVVPVIEKAFTRKGKLKSGYVKGIYIIPDNDGALVFYRPKRGRQEGQLIAVLKEQVPHEEQTDPEHEVDTTFIRKANRLFNFHLNKNAPRR